MSARDEVLARVRRANAEAASQAKTRAPGAEPPGAADASPPYRTSGDLTEAERLDLLADRLTDYRATVRRTTADGLAREVAAALTERGARRIVVPAGLQLPGPLPGIEVLADGGPSSAAESGIAELSPAELDACDGAVTGAAVAIAETGTIVLDGSPDQGRRAITLVPDYHLCIVRADQVVQLVPEAVARLADRAQAPLTWISGPSATSDIELERVEGVHGPRTLVVILVGP